MQWFNSSQVVPEQVLCVLPQAAQEMHLQKDYHPGLASLWIYSVGKITNKCSASSGFLLETADIRCPATDFYCSKHDLDIGFHKPKAIA